MNGVYKSEAGMRAIHDHYRAALRAWPVEHEERRVATPEGETFVLACGPADAPPVVLLHGSGSNSSVWASMVPDLAARLRVYAVDLPGEPGFSAQSRPPLASDRHAAWLDAVLEGLGVARASVVGMSLGGWVAVDHATRRPERVERLVLYCPGGIGGQKPLLGPLLLTLLGHRGRRRSARLILGPALAAMPGGGDEVLDQVLETTRSFRYRRERLPVFDDDALRRLVAPTLVLVGEQDAMFDSRGTAERLAAHAPRATVRLLPGVGHLVPPRTAEVLDFLVGDHAPGGSRK